MQTQPLQMYGKFAEDDICQLLGYLNLKGNLEFGAEPVSSPDVIILPQRPPSTSMSDSSDSDISDMMEIIDKEGNTQFISSSEMNSACGCQLLQELRMHIHDQAGHFNFLDVIFSHREAFLNFPAGHKSCAKAFTQLAFDLEHRAQQKNSDGDLDTAVALHNEAWLVSARYLELEQLFSLL